MMLKKLLLIFIFLCDLFFAQEQPSDKIDSLRIVYKYNLLFNSSSSLDINLPANIGYIPSIDNYLKLSSFEMNRIKNDINQSFLIYRAGQKKYYLGVVSDVLGYVSAAAAAGFAAYHVYKYRKEYGIK